MESNINSVIESNDYEHYKMLGNFQETVEKSPDIFIVGMCRKACKELWEKNIYAILTGVNLDNDICWIEILGDGLSQENKKIFESLDKVILFQKDNNILCIGININDKDSEKVLIDAVKKFKIQDVPKNYAYMTQKEYLDNQSSIQNEESSSDFYKEEDMIFEDDKVYYSKYHYNKHQNYLLEKLKNDGHQKAIQFFKHFVEELGLDSDFYRHLYSIPLINDTNNCDLSDAASIYDSLENCIYVNEDLLKNFLSNIKDKNKTEEYYVLNLAKIIIHEMLHANRVVMINNGMHVYNYNKKAQHELLMHEMKNKGHDINQYRMFLSQMLNKPYIKELKVYVPIKYTINDNNSYTIIAYDRNTKAYYEFNNLYFGFNTDDDFLHKVGIELNNNKYQGSYLMNAFNDDKSLPYLTTNYYYHDYSKNNHIVNDSDISNNPNMTYEQIMDKKVDRIKKTIDKDGFEEIMAETFAIIIMKMRNKNIKDLDKVLDEIYNDSESEIIEKEGVKLIQKLGKDFIKWYFTAAYAHYYDDMIEKVFKNQSGNLIDNCNMLYDDYADKELINECAINNINEIIENKRK